MGVGSKAKVLITERRWGRMSWIRFGEEGARTLLKSVVSLRMEATRILKDGDGERMVGDTAWR